MNNLIRPSAIIISLLSIVFIVLWGLGAALVPLLFSFALAYLVFPLIKRFEDKGLNRTYSVPIVFSFFVIIGLLILALVIPGLINDGKAFLKELPQNLTVAVQKIEKLASSAGYQVDLSRDSIVDYIKLHASDLSSGVLKSLTNGLKISFVEVSKWLLTILNLFLIPLFFFYVINDYEKISKEISSFIPSYIKPKLKHYLDLTNIVLSGYIRGQLMVALALSILYAIGLSIIGLKFGLLIGILSGLISIIPYAGFSIGFISAIVVGLANNSSTSQFLGIIIVFFIVQMMEGFIITPKLVGNKVGLSAFLTMLALIIGGNLFGIIGMLIAIPLAAIIKSILLELKREYLELDFHKC